MRPYARGRNRNSGHQRRSTLFGRTLLYLQLFCTDIAWLWTTRDLPAVMKAGGSAFLMVLMSLPVVYFLLCIASTIASIRLLTLDPVDWHWKHFDLWGAVGYKVSPREAFVVGRVQKNATNLLVILINVIDLMFFQGYDITAPPIWNNITRVPARHQFRGPTAWQRLLLYLAPFYDDLRAIWSNDPPFPVSVKVAITLGALLLLALPLVFITMIMPLATLASFQMVLGNLCPYDLTQHPVYEWVVDMLNRSRLGPREYEVFYKVIKQTMRKTSVKLSILVTSYDYLQTFRALGMDNPGNPEDVMEQ